MTSPDEESIKLIANCISLDFFPENIETRIRFMEDINIWYEGDQVMNFIQEFSKLFYFTIIPIVVRYFQFIKYKKRKMSELKPEFEKCYELHIENYLEKMRSKLNRIESLLEDEDEENNYLKLIHKNFSITHKTLNNKAETITKLQILFCKFSYLAKNDLMKFLKQYDRTKSGFRDYLDEEYPFIGLPKPN